MRGLPFVEECFKGGGMMPGESGPLPVKIRSKPEGFLGYHGPPICPQASKSKLLALMRNPTRPLYVPQRGSEGPMRATYVSRCIWTHPGDEHDPATTSCRQLSNLHPPLSRDMASRYRPA